MHVLVPLLACVACNASTTPEKTYDAQITRRIVVPAELALGDLLDADWIGDSSVALVAAPTTAVHVLRWRGGHVALGRKGSGPAEFQGLSSVVRVDSTRLIAVDGQLGRVSLWSTSGSLLGETSFEGGTIWTAWPADSGVIVRHVSGGDVRLVLVSIPEMKQRVLRTVQFDERWEPRLMAVGHDLTVVAGTPNDTLYRLLRQDRAGKPLPVLQRVGVTRPEIMQAELDSIAEFRRKVVAINSGMNPLQVKALKAAFSETPSERFKHLFASQPFVDQSGNVFIRRFTARGHSSEIDEFDSNGKFVSTIMLPEGTRIVRARNGYILTLRDSEAGEQLIEEYRVTAAR